MKKIIFASLIAFSGSAIAGGSGVLGDISQVEVVQPVKEQGFRGLVGLGVINAPTFAGVDNNESRAVPLINVSYNDTLYFQFNKVGAWLWKPKDSGFRVGVVAKARQGYDKGDGPLIDRELDDTTLVGLRAKWRTGMFSIDASYLGSTESDSGNETHITANYTFLASAQGTLSSFIRLENLSEEAIDYLYYANGEFDGADSAMNSTIGVVGTYNVSPRWTVMGMVSATAYDDAIEDAPGVTEDNGTTALLGVVYKF